MNNAVVNAERLFLGWRHTCEIEELKFEYLEDPYEHAMEVQVGGKSVVVMGLDEVWVLRDFLNEFCNYS